jgi:hypothetical protein
MTAPDKHERRFPTLAVVLCVVMALPATLSRACSKLAESCLGASA